MFVLKDFLRHLARPAIMGIVNATGDSFSEGAASSPETAVERGYSLALAGADILDIGGESSRPGAEKITAQMETDRVIPVLTGLQKLLPQMIFSIDTIHPETADAALKCGAQIINDVSMLRDSDELARCTARYNAALILNHSRAASGNMQAPEYCNYPNGTAADCLTELTAAKAKAVAAGVEESNIILDPGIGFSKTAAQCWELLRNLDKFGDLRDWAIGVSRKSFLAEATGEKEPARRLGESIALELELAKQHIGIIRTHAVRELHNAITTLAYFRS